MTNSNYDVKQKKYIKFNPHAVCYVCAITYAKIFAHKYTQIWQRINFEINWIASEWKKLGLTLRVGWTNNKKRMLFNYAPEKKCSNWKDE